MDNFIIQSLKQREHKLETIKIIIFHLRLHHKLSNIPVRLNIIELYLNHLANLKYTLSIYLL
jgi:hypothetical protein